MVLRTIDCCQTQSSLEHSPSWLYSVSISHQKAEFSTKPEEKGPFSDAIKTFIEHWMKLFERPFTEFNFPTQLLVRGESLLKAHCFTESDMKFFISSLVKFNKVIVTCKLMCWYDKGDIPLFFLLIYHEHEF